jgi:hypothetical protein
MYGLQGSSNENISTSPFKIYTPPAQIKQTLPTQPGVSYAQVTKQEFHTPTNIEQEPHIKQYYQQTRDMQELKKYDEKPF